MIRNIKNKAAEYYLKKAVNAFPRRKSTMDISNASSLLILADDRGKNLSVVVKYAKALRSERKSVSLLVFSEDNKKATEPDGYVRITKKDLNWYFKPKEAALHHVTGKPFDLLLDFSSKDIWPLLFVAASANAFLRAGMYSERKKLVHDVLLHSEADGKIEHFIEQAEYYLKIITQKS